LLSTPILTIQIQERKKSLYKGATADLAETKIERKEKQKQKQKQKEEKKNNQV
jgi:hypothetical protein